MKGFNSHGQSLLVMVSDRCFINQTVQNQFSGESTQMNFFC